MSRDEALLNANIRFKEVRCILDDGTQLGIMSSREALEIAKEKDLDLVLISPTANPPVCKIMDYGKFCYQKEKKLKEAKKKQKQIEIKEIRLSPKISANDIAYKVRHAIEFLNEGKHVKLKVFLRGREINDPSLGFSVLKKVLNMLEEDANIDNDISQEGRFINTLVTPKLKKELKKEL